MKTHLFNRFLAISIAVSASGLATSSALTITWDSANATSTSWDLDTNWVGGAKPVAGDDVVITGDGAFDPTNNASFAGTTINSLTLIGSTTVTLGTTVKVGAGGVYNNMASNSLFLSAELTADQIWGGTRTIFVNGSGITGTGKMTFEGSSVRFDVNSATWSAGLDVRTSVQMSTSAFADSTTISPWGTGTISLINQKTDLSTNTNPDLGLAAGAGNISLATANTLANDIVLQDPGAGNFSISQSANASGNAGTPPDHHYILSGVISGNVASARTLTFSNAKSDSAATFVLTNANTHTAETTLGGSNPVTLALGNVNALQNSTLNTGSSSAVRTVTFTSAGTNTYHLGGLKGADDLNIGANTISVGANNVSNSFTGAISGAGGFTKVGSGTQTFSVANSYDGITTVDSGAVEVTHGSALGGTTGGTTVSSGAALRLSGGITVGSEALALTGTGVSSDGALRNVSGDNVYNGLITFNGATRINSDSGTLTLGGGATGAQNVNFGGAGNITTTGNLAIGAGTITKDGSGMLTLGAANAFSGGTNFTGNTLTVAAAGALGTGSVTGTANAVLTFNTASDAAFNNNITLANPNYSGVVNASTTSTVTLNGAIATSGAYATLVGSGVNNAGFVLGGTISSSARFGLKDTNLTIASGGSLSYSAFQRLTLAEAGGTGAAVYLEDGVDLNTRIQDANNNNVTSDTMSFIVGMKSAGTSTFSGNGGVSVDLATPNNVNSLTNDWEFTAVSGGTANFTGKIQNSNTFNQATITKTGAGTVVFSAANTYAGSTTVADGKLTISSTGTINNTSQVIIAGGEFNYNSSTALTQAVIFSGTGGTLSGSGPIDQAVNITAGNTIAPGNSAGNLVLNNGLTLAGGYSWDLTTLSTANPGTDFDTITVTAGSVDISGASLGLNLGPNAPTAIAFWQTDQTWAGIINNTGGGSLTGFFASIDNSAWSSLGAFSTSNVGNDVNLLWTAVPESSSTILVGSFGVLALMRRRRC